MNFFQKLTNWYFSRNALPYWSILILDCLICYFSGIFVFWLYYHGAVTLGNIEILSKTILVYMIFNLIGFKVFRTYSGIFRYSSFIDLQRIGGAMALSCIIAEIFHYLSYLMKMHESLGFYPLQGRQILAMYVIATVIMWAVRVLVKTLYDISFNSENGRRTLIYGVRDGGIGLAKSIRNDKPSIFQLRGFVTHEADYKNNILLGVKVYQVNDKLEQVIKEKRITAFLVSPLQNENFRKDEKLQDILIKAGVRIYMSAESKEWTTNDKFSATALKEISIDDLLPRNEIQVDMEQVRQMIAGSKVLITGSAGSIGNEILKLVSEYKPSELMLIDIAETPQNDVKLLMDRKWPDIKTTIIVGSITNKERMERIFEQFRPDYVFHAAAYKHVPLMEENPSESIQNNVYGTKVMADLSAKYGVKKFVMLSTDKAVNPTNVMGCSKRICEIYVQSLDAALKKTQKSLSPENGITTTQFVTTRFGNVLGSNGSVIPLFKRQIQTGGPITVTDPNIIRYFMLIPEACKLVLEAGTYGKGGEIFVFDMGSPVRIADLAKRMISLSGAHNVEIKYTGLRPGEKLYEEVLSNDENTKESFHEKIRIACVREYDYEVISKEIDELIALSNTYDEMAIVKKMKEIVPEYISNNSVFGALDH